MVEKAAEDGPSVRGPTTPEGDLEDAPSSMCQPGLAPAIVALRGVNQQREEFSSVSLPFK